MKFNQQQHTNLVDELRSWWVSNGWNIATLQRKSINELLAIKGRMGIYIPKPVVHCPPVGVRYQQVSLW